MAALSDLKRSQRQATQKGGDESAFITAGSLSDPTSDLEIFAKEVLNALISDNLPPTPNNFSLYFDRILEDKSESLRRQIGSILELEEDNHDESSIELEKTLKQGFSSVKSILQLSATLYKNISLMEKILEKRKEEMKEIPSLNGANKLKMRLFSIINTVSITNVSLFPNWSRSVILSMNLNIKAPLSPFVSLNLPAKVSKAR